MTASELPWPLLAAVGGLAVGALVSLRASRNGFRRRRASMGTTFGLLGLLFLLGSLLGIAILLGLRGYRALTREELAATVRVTPLGPQRFEAHVTTPGGGAQTFLIDGDELYVDARILKWKPIANILGLHTDFALDRIGGRFEDIEDERTRARSLFQLSDPGAIDLFAWRRKAAVLSPLYDASYGSGTFTAVDRPATLHVLVSTTGLLVRPAVP